jgi:hypothetical protein
MLYFSCSISEKIDRTTDNNVKAKFAPAFITLNT